MTIESPFSHLNEKTQKLLLLSDKERIQSVREDRWIPYTRAKEVLEHMEELFDYPRINRMPNMLLVGASNNGKTHILKRFLASHSFDPNPDEGYSIIPVIFVEAPKAPDVGALYDNIFEAIHQPYSSRASIREQEEQVLTVLEKIQLKMLIIDEIQHLIAGGQARQREFRNAIKGLGNTLKISIVASGVEEAFNAFNTDPQLSNRFEPQFLPKWKMDDEYGKLLVSLERNTPLKLPSKLYENELAQKIYFMSEGIIGEIHEIVKRAAVKAIRIQKEQISMDILNSIRWVQPSKRKQQPPLG